jgi:hypothetical protein
MKNTQITPNQPQHTLLKPQPKASRNPHISARHWLVAWGMLICLGSSLLSPALVQADEDKAPPSGRSSGGRGCSSATMPTQGGIPALILIAPSQQPGQTTSTRPSFAWFVRDAVSVPMEFRLYERKANGFTLIQEIKGAEFKSTPGIMLLNPTASMPELQVGQRYRWQVELVCDAGRPSSNLFAESDLEVVPLHAGLKSQLAQSPDRLVQAKLYDQANLWYDLLSTVFAPTADGASVAPARAALLDRVAINPAEQKLLQTSKIYPIQP